MRIFATFILLMMGLGFAIARFLHLGGVYLEYSDVFPTWESQANAPRELAFSVIYLASAAVVGYWPTLRRAMRFRQSKQ
jgi:hypothetical protein